MANDLTGDFDVVAEFAVPAANRVLAAMHRIERFPHSVATSVDDNPPPGSKPDRPTMVGSVDVFGEPSVDHHRIEITGSLAGQLMASTPAYSALDPVVNIDVAGVNVGPIVPSHLQGRAQLQLSPPTIEVTDGSGTNVTVRFQIISRYFPDPHTSPLASFVRGELQITAAVNQVASQDARVVDIDIKGANVGINFTPAWSSSPLSAEDLAAVNLVIRNGLKTSFLPSNSQLPSGVKHIQFKTVRGARDALAVLLNLPDPDPDLAALDVAPGDPASSTNVFLGSGDEFAIAVGADYVRKAFAPTVNSILNTPVADVVLQRKILGHTFHYTYNVSLDNASVDLQAGKIVLNIWGHAHTETRLPDFNFTVQQDFTLWPGGGTAYLIVGDISLDTSSWVVDLFKGAAKGSLEHLRNQALNDSDARTIVSQMLSADAKLGGLLTSLLTPPSRVRIDPPPRAQLAYTSIEIRPAGIVLHGSLAVSDWPAGYVQFSQIPDSGSRGGIGTTDAVDLEGPQYSALRSWIPGGTIQQFEWSSQGQAQPLLVEANKFVYIRPPPLVSDGTPSTGTGPTGTGPTGTGPRSAVSDHGIFDLAVSDGVVAGFAPLCLTIRGTRLSSSGPVVAQQVSASVCGYRAFPVVSHVGALGGTAPLVALAHPGPGGLVQIAGHTSATADQPGAATPNLIVHFADEKSASHLELLTRALKESGRKDAPTAVLVVMNPEQLAKTRYTPGIIYSDDRGTWERLFDVKATGGPVTLIAGPKRAVAWRHEGDLESRTLAAALRESLVASAPVTVSMLPASIRLGQPPPNFLFEHAAGRELTLRKLRGRRVVLVFWNSSSKASIEAVQGLQKGAGLPEANEPVVFAINDGESAESAKRIAAEYGLSATVVADPERKISTAYGVSIWPTIVHVDATSLVEGIHYGRSAGGKVERPKPGRSTAE